MTCHGPEAAELHNEAKRFQDETGGLGQTVVASSSDGASFALHEAPGLLGSLWMVNHDDRHLGLNLMRAKEPISSVSAVLVIANCVSHRDGASCSSRRRHYG